MAKGVIIMPYKLRVGKNGYYVINTDTGKAKNKTPLSKSRAKKYMAALYANKNPKQYETKNYGRKKGNWRNELRKAVAKIL